MDIKSIQEVTLWCAVILKTLELILTKVGKLTTAFNKIGRTVPKLGPVDTTVALRFTRHVRQRRKKYGRRKPIR